MVDGTTLSMPDTAQNQNDYPRSDTQQPGVGFPLCRLVGILNLNGCAVIDVAFGPCEGKGSSEQGLLRKLLDNLNKGDVCLGDAIIPSFFLRGHCNRWELTVCVSKWMGEKGALICRTGESLGPTVPSLNDAVKTKPSALFLLTVLTAPLRESIRQLCTVNSYHS